MSLAVMLSLHMHVEGVRLFDLLGAGQKSVDRLQRKLFGVVPQASESYRCRELGWSERLIVLVAEYPELRPPPLLEYLKLYGKRAVSQHSRPVRTALVLRFGTARMRVLIRGACTRCKCHNKGKT